MRGNYGALLRVVFHGGCVIRLRVDLKLRLLAGDSDQDFGELLEGAAGDIGLAFDPVSEFAISYPEFLGEPLAPDQFRRILDNSLFFSRHAATVLPRARRYVTFMPSLVRFLSFEAFFWDDGYFGGLASSQSTHVGSICRSRSTSL